MTQPICVQKDFLSFFYYCYVGFLIKASKFISCLCIFKALRKKFRAYLFQHLVGVEIEGKNNIFIIYNQEKEEKYSFIRIPGLCIKIKGNNKITLPLSEMQSVECIFSPKKIKKRENGGYTISGRFEYNNSKDKMTLTQFCSKRSIEIKNK